MDYVFYEKFKQMESDLEHIKDLLMDLIETGQDETPAKKKEPVKEKQKKVIEEVKEDEDEDETEETYSAPVKQVHDEPEEMEGREFDAEEDIF